MGKKGRLVSEEQRTIRFAIQVAKDKSTWENCSRLEWRVPGECTIEKASCRIYIGPQLNLKIKPFIERTGGGNMEPIVNYVGKQYIDGDDDQYFWELGIPLFTDDLLVVEAINESVDNDYDYTIEFALDFRGGASRWPLHPGMTVEVK